MDNEALAEESAKPSSRSQTEDVPTSSFPSSSSAPCTTCSSAPVAVFTIDADEFANVQDVLDAGYIRSRLALLSIQRKPSSTKVESASASTTTTASASKRPASSLTCQQRIPADGPTGQQVSDALQANGAFETICAAEFNGRSGNSTFKVFNHGSLNIILQRASESIKLTFCMDALDSIINDCILADADYGGVYSQGGQTYEITNTIYPANPLVPGGDAGAPSVTTSQPDVPSTPPPEPAAQPGPPTPTQIKSNNKGSGLCPFLAGACIFAYTGYKDDFLYTARTSYPATAGDAGELNFFFPEVANNGCAAIFTCDNDEAFGVGMTGAQIKAA